MRAFISNNFKSSPSQCLFKMVSLLVLIARPTSTVGKAILGVDLGSLYMKVALVQRNSPLEIVTNLHSKRKTEQMVLFDNGSRFYGADASSLLGRKPHLTPAAMTLMLGRDHEHPSVQVLKEQHYPLTPQYNETRSGVCLTVDGAQFTPEELVAMILTHAKDITAAYSSGSTQQVIPRDCVLTVPSFFTQHERRALLDAAALADLNVLALIDENTAAGLHFGMEIIDVEPKNVLFYNMGASALQVSVMTFHSYEHKESKFAKAKTVGAFEVKGKGWDANLGGAAFDNRLVEFMADEFNKHWNDKRNDGLTKDVRVSARAMTKLRLQANKAKHILSANSDIPIFIDSLLDDTYYQSHLSRAKFEEISHDLLLRSVQPIHDALKAANMTLKDIDMIELIGGGMRIPALQDEIRKALANPAEGDGDSTNTLELGLHINSDESMALGAAFHGANVSTAFRVRHLGMTDVNPFPISVSLEDMPVSESEEEKTDDDEDVWSKKATLFKSFGKIGVKKTIAFTHDSDVQCAIDYEDSDILPKGSALSIERYNITGVSKFAQEMKEKDLKTPKVSLQFELSTSGIVQLLKAEASVEEIVIVEEQVEVEDNETDTEADTESEDDESKEENDKEAEAIVDATEEETNEEETNEEENKDEEPTKGGDATENSAGENSTNTVSDNKNETKGDESKDTGKKEKEKKPKMKMVTVKKEKKKLRKRVLTVDTYHVGRVKPYSEDLLEESEAKLQDLADKDKARMMLEESRNKVEAYTYHIKNKLSDDEEIISRVSTEEERTSLLESASKAEDWLYEDGYDADLPTFEEKYVELSTPAEAIFFRVAELEDRPRAIKVLQKRLEKIEDLMKKWETTMPQVTEEERSDVLQKVENVRTWIADKEKEQEKVNAWDTPAFVSTDVPSQARLLEKMVTQLSKKPKPKPVVKEKKNDTSTSTEEEKKEDESKEEIKEDSSEEKNKEDDSETEGEDVNEGEDAEKKKDEDVKEAEL